jgi:3-oxoadipate enol-lactonase
MPFTDCGDLRVHYEVTGPANAPVLLFSNSLGTNFSMWDSQLAAVEKQFRVLRYDTRGHGRTTVTPGPYTIELLGRDVLRLLDRLKIERVNFCGLSKGGMIGMWFGVHAPERLHKLILCNTAAKIGTVESWNGRIKSVREGGMKSIAPAVIERWFTPEFRERSPEIISQTKRMIGNSPAEGYIACCGAIRDMDQRDTISAIRIPTLVISGTRDPVIPLGESHFISEQIPGAHSVDLEAAHLSNIEASEKFTSAIIRFLTA